MEPRGWCFLKRGSKERCCRAGACSRGTSNSATGSGGGIYNFGSADTHLYLKNVLIANSPTGEAGFAYMWHSHNEREITTNNIFPGGMLMMMLCDPRAYTIDESN